MVTDKERFYIIASQAYYWLQDAYNCEGKGIAEGDVDAVYEAMAALECFALAKEPNPLPAHLVWKEKKQRRAA